MRPSWSITNPDPVPRPTWIITVAGSTRFATSTVLALPGGGATGVRVTPGLVGADGVAVVADESVRRAMGVDVARTRVIAFTLTSVLAGIAGMVYAFVDNTVNPPIFGLENAFLILFMVIVGGAGRHAGAVIGAVLLFLLPFWLSPVVGYHHQLVFGALVVASILLWPKGLIGLWDRFSR